MDAERTPGIGATNRHRLLRLQKAGTSSVRWRCSGCAWEPVSPAKLHGDAREQHTRHLYELVPKRRA